MLLFKNMDGINLYWFLTSKKIIVITYLIIVSPKPGKYELDATRIAQQTASQRTSDTAAQQHCHFSGHLNLVFHTSF